MHKIGIVKATSLVAGNMIGSGVLLAPALLAPYGTLSIIGWIVTTLGALALALVFSQLSRWIPYSGGPYTYAKHVFGDFIGFQMAWGYWISAWCGSVSLLTGTLQYMSIFCPNLVAQPVFSIGFGCLMIWLFTWFNVRGIKEATFIEVIIVVIKIVPLVIIALIGICFVDFKTVFSVKELKNCDFSSMGPMFNILLWSFIGLESATIPSDQVENPKKTIPIATIVGVLIVAAVYILGAIAITGLIPHDELLVSKAPYVDAGMKLFGNGGAVFMIITGVLGIVGSLNGWILLQGQVPCAAAQENLFPKYFGKKNKYGAPSGVVIGSLLMTLLFVLSYQPSLIAHINLLINVAVLAMLLPYFYSAIAFCYLFVSKKHELSRIEKIFLPMAGGISIIYTFAAIFGSGTELMSVCFLMFLLSVPFYCLMKK
ncbi:MAG: amino acid permease [bacterium]